MPASAYRLDDELIGREPSAKVRSFMVNQICVNGWACGNDLNERITGCQLAVGKSRPLEGKKAVIFFSNMRLVGKFLVCVVLFHKKISIAR